MDENINGEKLTEDMAPPQKKQKKRSKAADIIQLSLIFIFGGIFVVSLILLVINYIGKVQGSIIYSDIANNNSVFNPNSAPIVQMYAEEPLKKSDSPMQTLEKRISSGSTDSLTPSTGEHDRLSEIRSALEGLKEQNSDVYGWIYVGDSDINYPIVQGNDNSFYLNHDINKKYLAIGTVFADYNCKEKVTDNFNTVFYGHNVVSTRFSSSMFHDVTKFLDKDYFENTLIYIYTMDGMFVYKPFSVYPTTSDHFYFTTDFANEASFLQFAKDVKALSNIRTDTEIKEGDTVITLSTCTNGPKNARYALHAVLVDFITDAE